MYIIQYTVFCWLVKKRPILGKNFLRMKFLVCNCSCLLQSILRDSVSRFFYSGLFQESSSPAKPPPPSSPEANFVFLEIRDDFWQLKVHCRHCWHRWQIYCRHRWRRRKIFLQWQLSSLLFTPHKKHVNLYCNMQTYISYIPREHMSWLSWVEKALKNPTAPPK